MDFSKKGKKASKREKGKIISGKEGLSSSQYQRNRNQKRESQGPGGGKSWRKAIADLC